MTTHKTYGERAMFLGQAGLFPSLGALAMIGLGFLKGSSLSADESKALITIYGGLMLFGTVTTIGMGWNYFLYRMTLPSSSKKPAPQKKTATATPRSGNPPRPTSHNPNPAPVGGKRLVPLSKPR